jgi:hypothetical protein
VTVKLQLLPPLAQLTVVFPTGNVEPEGGLQITGGVAPVSGSTQLPDVPGVANVTTALQSAVPTGATAGQLTVHGGVVAPTTVDVKVAVLSGRWSSVVPLASEAVFEISVPAARPPSTMKVTEKVAGALAASVPIEQLIVPPLGPVHENPGPEF